MPNRWTQEDEDPARLPEGVKRVGYDTDTARYTFLDRKGTIYKGEPGSEYGHITPVPNPIAKVESERPEAFEDLGNPRARPADVYAPKTFQEFVPPSLITSPSTSPDDPSPPSSRFGLGSKSHRRSGSSISNASSSNATASNGKHVAFGEGPVSPREKFKAAVRGSAVPKMSGVVKGLKRSLSSATGRKKKDSEGSGFWKGGVGRDRSKSESQGFSSLGGYAELLDDKDKEDPKGHSRSEST
ncbi:hypothetical protein D9611_008638 [Ephemerocybe angulata]|uniref:Uncharacterized protein n=1 Tax=Ephemerocybe angulata TaxID=980116 RepID=A0A8H5AYV7_9AGAR|nr:hypothetical protein D9611_008638 [Tulosesus angulatus]